MIQQILSTFFNSNGHKHYAYIQAVWISDNNPSEKYNIIVKWGHLNHRLHYTFTEDGFMHDYYMMDRIEFKDIV